MSCKERTITRVTVVDNRREAPSAPKPKPSGSGGCDGCCGRCRARGTRPAGRS